jgi:hypothetical protein
LAKHSPGATKKQVASIDQIIHRSRRTGRRGTSAEEVTDKFLIGSNLQFSTVASAIDYKKITANRKIFVKKSDFETSHMLDS